MILNNVPKTVYSSEVDDRAKEGEILLDNVLGLIIRERITREDEISGKSYDHPVFQRSEQQEDEEQRFDFSIGFPIVGSDGKQTGYEYRHMDYTTAKDPHVLNDKRKKERDTGIIIFQFPLERLRLAAMGGEYYIAEVRKALRQALDLE